MCVCSKIPKLLKGRKEHQNSTFSLSIKDVIVEVKLVRDEGEGAIRSVTKRSSLETPFSTGGCLPSSSVLKHFSFFVGNKRRRGVSGSIALYYISLLIGFGK